MPYRNFHLLFTPKMCTLVYTLRTKIIISGKSKMLIQLNEYVTSGHRISQMIFSIHCISRDDSVYEQKMTVKLNYFHVYKYNVIVGRCLICSHLISS